MRGLALAGVFILAAIGGFGPISAQDLDEILARDTISQRDTNTVNLLIRRGQELGAGSPTEASAYYRAAGALSESINHPTGILKYISNQTYILNMQGRYQESLELNLRPVSIATELNDSLALAKCLFNTGTSYQYLNEYETAIGFYAQGKLLFERYDNNFYSAIIADILQTLYQKLHRYEEALQYGKQSIDISRKGGLGPQLGYALTNMAVNYTALNRPEEALSSLDEALAISQKQRNLYVQEAIHLNYAEAFEQLNRFEQMRTHALAAQKIAGETADVSGEGEALLKPSAYALYGGDMAEALSLGNRALVVFRDNSLATEEAKALQWLGDVSLANGDIPEYLNYQAEGSRLSNTLLNQNIQDRILALEQKYRVDLQRQKVELLENRDRRQQDTLSNRKRMLLVLSGLVFLLFVSAFLAIRNIKHKLTIREKRINKLELEQQLMATEAVLTGEENERARVARDLHDGLGGLLSGVKYSFQSMKGNMDIPLSNKAAYDKGIQMLDTSIEEIGRIAHNMLPETPLKFGLDTALRDFCSNANVERDMKVSYQSIGMQAVALDQSRLIGLYRIVQELVYNALKHSHAREVIVQLIHDNGRLSLAVEDDGRGFDPALLDQAMGIGWNNIRNRVNLPKGTLDLQTAPEMGTTVEIIIGLWP